LLVQLVFFPGLVLPVVYSATDAHKPSKTIQLDGQNILGLPCLCLFC